MAVSERKLPSPATTRLASRTFAVWLVLMTAAIALLARIWFLQVWTAGDLKNQARRQQVHTLRPFIARRTIVDRHGTVLAVDRPSYTLFAHPHLYKPALGKTRDRHIKEIAGKLATILGRPPATIESLLDRDSTSVQIEYWMSEDKADRIQALGIDGFDLVQQRHRQYPQQDLAAEILGYVDVDHRGQAGIERSQEKLLEQGEQESLVTRDGNGRLIPSGVPAGVIRVDRSSLQLTLDARLQRVARQSLRQQMKKYGAKRGTVIVMDVKDGGLRTLVTEPTYDPNRYNEYKIEDASKRGLYKNWSVSDLYEPGSTFKPINVAIALESGAIQTDTVFNDEGSIMVGGWPIANFDYDTAGSPGPLSISQILQRSSNVGMVRIIQQMKPAIYYGWLERLGLGDVTGIDLPGETPSTLKPQDQFTMSAIEPAVTAFGQGLSLTPIQMLQLHGILASGGKLLTPHVVKGLINEDGEEYYQPKFSPPRQIFSPKTTAAVLDMMTSVVEIGTGKPARIPGYRIGGKTGTAQKADASGGYARSAKITSFVGIFPSNAPRFVVLAVIDEPIGDDAFGSTVAAPIVKTVIEDIIVSDKIPPNAPQEVISEPIAPSPSPAAPEPTVMPSEPIAPTSPAEQATP